MGKLEKVQKYVKKGNADKLAALANDKDKEIRMAAIEGLGEINSNERALNTLVGLLEDDDADIRRAVVAALGKSEGSYVETQLRYCLSHEKDERVLETAKESLARMKEKKS
nr:HEAT repeat domain-containing protein [uncultured Marvinbryantia sp.]